MEKVYMMMMDFIMQKEIVNAISSGKKTVMFNNDSGRGVNSGPTLAFRSSTDPDGSNIFGKSILGVTD